MATPQISFNPFATTNAAGLFSLSSVGFTQGVATDDPAIRNSLAGGVLAATETLPMWGGVGIFEDISATGGNPVGNNVGRATSLTATAAAGLSGFSVYNEGHAGILTPGTVPIYMSLQTVNFYRLGSGARIAVQASPGLAALLETGAIGQQVSWDFASQQLVPFAPSYTATTLTGATWANTAGGQITYTGLSQDLTSALSAGKIVDVSGIVSTGGTGVGYNGSFTVVSVTSSTLVVTFVASASPGTYSSGGTIAAGGGALACKVLQILPTGCKVVTYNSNTNIASWNNNGSAAVILI